MKLKRKGENKMRKELELSMDDYVERALSEKESYYSLVGAMIGQAREDFIHGNKILLSMQFEQNYGEEEYKKDAKVHSFINSIYDEPAELETLYEKISKNLSFKHQSKIKDMIKNLRSAIDNMEAFKGKNKKVAPNSLNKCYKDLSDFNNNHRSMKNDMLFVFSERLDNFIDASINIYDVVNNPKINLKPLTEKASEISDRIEEFEILVKELSRENNILRDKVADLGKVITEWKAIDSDISNTNKRINAVDQNPAKIIKLKNRQNELQSLDELTILEEKELESISVKIQNLVDETEILREEKPSNEIKLIELREEYSKATKKLTDFIDTEVDLDDILDTILKMDPITDQMIEKFEGIGYIMTRFIEEYRSMLFTYIPPTSEDKKDKGSYKKIRGIFLEDGEGLAISARLKKYETGITQIYNAISFIHGKWCAHLCSLCNIEHGAITRFFDETETTFKYYQSVYRLANDVKSNGMEYDEATIKKLCDMKLTNSEFTMLVNNPEYAFLDKATMREKLVSTVSA